MLSSPLRAPPAAAPSSGMIVGKRSAVPTLPQPSTMVQGKCACCDTRLKYPSNVHCYRCTVCTAVTDLSPITPKRLPKALKLDRLYEIKERWEMEDDAGREILEKEVSRVFASFEALTASFSTGDEPSPTTPEIDYATLSRAISTITSLDSPPLIDNILKSLEILLRRPGLPMTSPTALRLIPLILRSTLLSPPSVPKKRSVLSRLVGWVSGAGNNGHHIIVTWLSQWSREDLRSVVEGVGALIAYRLSKAEKITRDVGNGIRGKKSLVAVLDNEYTTDWRTKAAAKMMALLHAASNMSTSSPPLPISEFYCTMIDYIDLISDFRDWERGECGFAFCQYPLLISLGSKIIILEYDARRQMEVKAREAFFETLTTKKVVRPHLLLRIRRANLMEDSMRQLRAVEGGELKKGLRIQFEGEDGVDAGGLRKEWFLILVREIFDPKYGLFVEEESSGVVWFDPASTSKEALEKYYLAGVVVGLAIYNSTILDVRLPRALFTKLMGGRLGLEDMEGWKPEFVKGLRQLLEFEGDVESVLGLDFTVHDIYGSLRELVPNGSRLSVTNANRKEYVDAYVAYLLNTSVNAQYSTFRDGFWRVCGGNAMGLFNAEEVEGLVCGLGMGEEGVDVGAIRAVAVYEGYRRGPAGPSPTVINPEKDPLITWFWAFFSSLPGADQRRLLRFVTGSDRVPATGAANLAFKISVMPEVNGGEDRFPIAHTCFNQIVLPRYKRREKMEGMLRRAMWENSYCTRLLFFLDKMPAKPIATTKPIKPAPDRKSNLISNSSSDNDNDNDAGQGSYTALIETFAAKAAANKAKEQAAAKEKFTRYVDVQVKRLESSAREAVEVAAGYTHQIETFHTESFAALTLPSPSTTTTTADPLSQSAHDVLSRAQTLLSTTSNFSSTTTTLLSDLHTELDGIVGVWDRDREALREALGALRRKRGRGVEGVVRGGGFGEKRVVRGAKGMLKGFGTGK
ncbi:hypothetical protein SAICODRAFT_73143 [Saitoella complicata NRRL Y-17804]|uniref:uncharacterized protein n=1 Tax=Saitoella complicata (strain BCRC 22490 / CBS 7301 / JCM 7358 / NBRC 10748 / NRRL Y-17804) TaxID=698492 RepID=UPI00086685A5|nr:uncharacterized protein SAICODRAFT_73143 [Saitoella complicata NRRL Y-17804]ODQ50626.1 hypothetical protein SAICODRAFT_73143 [Saitoella complicata NRRL Y-17804]